MITFPFLDGDVDGARRVLAIVAGVVHGEGADAPVGNVPTAAAEERALPDLFELMGALPAIDVEAEGAPEDPPQPE